MLDAQDAAYGDGLDPDYRHQYMWAVKPHYFTPFYNWPYTFGLLFGIGLYARYLDDPERFRAGYDDLLSATGHGRRGRRSPAGSASTCATARSGRPASTCCGPASTITHTYAALPYP